MWTVHEPGIDRDAYEGDSADRVALVKDGFSWPGFLLSLPWLVYHRLWLALLGFLIVSGLLGAAGTLLPIDDNAGMLLGTLPALFLGIDGNDMRRRKLAARGFVDRGAVVAANMAEAELVYFRRAEAAGLLKQTQPAVPVLAAAQPARPTLRPVDRDVLGLFPEPGRR